MKLTTNVVEAQSRVEQLNKIGVNAEPVDVSARVSKIRKRFQNKPKILSTQNCV